MACRLARYHALHNAATTTLSSGIRWRNVQTPDQVLALSMPSLARTCSLTLAARAPIVEVFKAL